MLPNNNNNNNGNYSERESTRSKFKRAFAFIRRPGPSSAQDDPGFQSDYVPQTYSKLSNTVPASSNTVTSTAPVRRPNPKMALQFASNTIQAWGRKPKQPVHSSKTLPEPPGLPPPWNNPHAPHLAHPTHDHHHHHQRPSPAIKTPPHLTRVIQRTSQLLPGPDISAALEYILDAGAGSGDKRKPSNLERAQQPISQSSHPPPLTHTPPITPLPTSTSSSANIHSGTIDQSSPHSPDFPTQSPSRTVPRRASMSNDSHPTPTPTPTPTQQRKRRSASLGTLDVLSILSISSSDQSVSNPNPNQPQPPFSPNVPPSSYHAPPSKTGHLPPPQPAQASTVLETSSPPHSPPFISEPSNRPAIAASPVHLQSFQSEIQNMQGGSLNTRVGFGIRGKLAGWTTAGANDSPSSSLSSQREHARSRSAGGLIGQFAPAATGVAKRAYEKVNNLWSGGHSNTSQTSVGRGEGGSVTDREGSNKPWHNRTPNGPSGNWGATADERATRPGSSGRSMNDAISASDAMGNGMGSGPNLGMMLRPPFRRVTPGSGGVVFARPLAECVRDTKPLVVLGNDLTDIGIEERFIPALVLRCVQHLERWGVQEEGLFRISGRASHVNKLRNEFASGADYDLASCGPGDLDPHAVSSVLKAFLRELPDPILTRDVAPAFEATLEKAKASGAMNPPPMPTVFQGPGVGPRVGAPLGTRLGLPVGPRQNSMPLSRFFNNDVHIVPGAQPVEVTAPSSAAPVRPPNSLLREFNGLVQKLPRENRDLLQTIVELLARAAVHSKTTKMPLSNLLLVFCPSVGINPSVFKIMVENHEPIFDQALLPPPSPTASEHPSEDSVVYEDINAANTTSQPTPSTDYHHPRTPPPLPRAEPTGLQLDLNPLLLVHPTGASSESASASASEPTHLHSPALSPELKVEMMKSSSPQPPPLVSSPQTTSHGVLSSVSPSLTPSSSNPPSTSELNTTIPNRPLPKPPKRIPVPYALRPAASESSLQSHSSAMSMPSANPPPSITSLPTQQDLLVAPQDISNAPSAFTTHPLRLQTSFDKPLPNPFSSAAPEKADAPSPVSPSLPSPAPEDDQDSGDDADSEAKPGRRQYPRVISMAPALPELQSLPPMTASFTGSTPPPLPPPPMPSLPPLELLNLNPKSMFTSTIAPLKVKGRGNEPAKLVPSRTATFSSTASSLGSSISRQLSPAIPPLVNEPASVKDDASDEKLVEVSDTLPLGSMLTPLMKAMEVDMIRADGVQEKTSGSDPSDPLEQSRPSSAEPPSCVDSPPVAPSPHIAESSKLTLDTFVFDPYTQPTPEVPINAALPTTTAFAAPSIADLAPEDVAIPEDEISAASKVECNSPSIRELIPTEINGTKTHDHLPLSPAEGLGINEVVDVVEHPSTSPSSPSSPSSPTDTLPQGEEVLDASILTESHIVAPPRLAPPGEGRFSGDWVASVLKAATTSP